MDQEFRSVERREKRPHDLSATPTQRKPQRKKERSKTIWIGAFLLSSVVLGVGFFQLSQAPVNEANLPVIMEAKEDACIKVRPNATENTSVPYSNISIYSELEENSKEPAVEQLLPETEKPVVEAKVEKETVDTPPIEMVQVAADETPKTTEEPLVCKLDTTKTETASEQPAEKPTSKTRESLNEAMQKTMRSIYNDANGMIAENITHGKKMPDNTPSNSKLKIVTQTKSAPAKETVLVAKSTPAAKAKIVPATAQQPLKPIAKAYWVEFKPVSTSQDAERMWNQLATNASAKAALVGVQHKVQKQTAAEGGQGYRLYAGPYTKEEAIACAQTLRKAKVNCRVINKK
jgi:hypothetical protein